MKKTTCCLASLSLLTGCVAENSKHSKTDNPYYHVEKVETDKGTQLEKITISGPPTPPKGYDRPVVKPDTTTKKDYNSTP
ncbi:MAG: hypothetical protein P794_07860 [Epsilonproteobacteria bacterium (ex Lamellibrachia satsuma)]|nr:MAG: hypothetical protein P794_07860 [Epsilonproteobacteria bacterium (ex Lamellibrachia satsuma)]